MNRYILIRRLRGPALLLLIGLIALLHSTGVIHSFWHWFWPLAVHSAGRAAAGRAGSAGLRRRLSGLAIWRRA